MVRSLVIRVDEAEFYWCMWQCICGGGEPVYSFVSLIKNPLYWRNTTQGNIMGETLNTFILCSVLTLVGIGFGYFLLKLQGGEG